MPRMDKLSPYRTHWTDDGKGHIVVVYVQTAIVTTTQDTVTLNSGGYRTVTTKRKMVQAANQFGLGYTVSQRKGEWTVTRLGRSPEGYPSADPKHGAIDLPFVDGITFPRGAVRDTQS